MDTCFQPLELDSLAPGSHAASWPVTVLEECSRLASEIHDPLVQDFIVVPPLPEAEQALNSAYGQEQDEQEVQAKRFGDLVGQSAALRHVASQVDVVAPTEASVII